MININAKITSFDTVFSYNLQEFPEINTDNYTIEKVVSINGNFETAIVNKSTFTLTPNIFTDFEDNIIVHLRYTSKKDINIVDNRAIEFQISVEGAKNPFILRNTGNSATTFSIIHGASAKDLTFYYRIDDNDIGFEYIQDALSGTSATSKSYTIPAGKAFYIYAEHWNNYIAMNQYSDIYFNRFSGISRDIRFDGDIRQINGGKSGCFCYLFEGCSNMVDAPELNFTKNDGAGGYSAYMGMFDGCTNLRNCPSRLPFTTIYTYSYARMFRNCKSLTSAPIIDATVIARYSMESMFEGCTSLINAPEIKVVNLNSDNYSNPKYQMRYMFKGCTSLVNPPDILPCTQLYEGCYYQMFKDCTSLVKSTKFYTNTNVNKSFERMFEGCTSLTQIMDLPSNMIALYAANAMFSGCTSLTEVDLTFTGNYRSLGGMFLNCTGLTKASITAPNIEYCPNMFSGCSNLSYIKLDTGSFSNNTSFTFGVAASGTFLKRANVDIPTGVDGIPSGWTVITIT